MKEWTDGDEEEKNGGGGGGGAFGQELTRSPQNILNCRNKNVKLEDPFDPCMTSVKH